MAAHLLDEPLDRDTPGTIRLRVTDATVLGVQALRRLEFPDEDVHQ